MSASVLCDFYFIFWDCVTSLRPSLCIFRLRPSHAMHRSDPKVQLRLCTHSCCPVADALSILRPCPERRIYPYEIPARGVFLSRSFQSINFRWNICTSTVTVVQQRIRCLCPCGVSISSPSNHTVSKCSCLAIPRYCS